MLYRDADLVRRIGVATALEVRACGIQYTFAPCVAVSSCKCNWILLLSSLVLICSAAGFLAELIDCLIILI